MLADSMGGVVEAAGDKDTVVREKDAAADPVAHTCQEPPACEEPASCREPALCHWAARQDTANRQDWADCQQSASCPDSSSCHDSASFDVSAACQDVAACQDSASCKESAACPAPGAGQEPVPSELILNLLHPEDGPAAGLPYQPHFLGPPQPPCEDARQKTIMALNTLEGPEDPEIGSILRTVASIFHAPAALVAKFDDKRVYVSESQGVVPRGDFPWRWTLCAWSLAYKNPQILVVPDTLQDSRFCHNAKVTSGPHVRFYCGAPLVASNGHRLGTLCFLDIKPREFDAASAFIMNNFAELVVRRLEKDIALKLVKEENSELLQVYGGLQRAVNAVDTCVLLVDLQAEGWSIVYANAALQSVTGTCRDAVLNKPLCDVLVGPVDGVTLPLESHRAAVSKLATFTVDHVRFRDSSQDGLFTLSWRPACRALDDATALVGVPSFLRLQGTPGDEGSVDPKRYYFVTVDVAKERRSSASSNSSMVSTGSLEGLQLAHLLGKGSFGSVYAGTWFGAPVAVKVIDQELWPLCPGAASLEALLGVELRHPHIVSTLHYATRPITSTSTISDSARNSGRLTPASGHSGGFSQLSTLDDSCRKLWVVFDNTAALAGQLVEDGEPSSSLLHTAGTAIDGAIEEEDGDVDEDAETHDGPQSLTLSGEIAGGWGRCQAAASSRQPSRQPDNCDDDSADGGGVAGGGRSRSCHVAPQLRSAGDSGCILVSPTGNGGACNSSWTPQSVSNGCASGVGGGGGSGGGAMVKHHRHRRGAGRRDSNGSSGVQTTIILEYCDKGSLQEAIDRGWLQTQRSSLHGVLNMEAVLTTASEIASAMAFLHDRRIVHGDLSAWNVMLTSSSSSLGSRGFVAKVADFGLSHNMHSTSRVLTNTYGTLTHMPPETLTNGVISLAMDVYSFGVLLWQMYTSSRPWAGLRYPQIVMLVGQQHKALQFLPDAHPGYVRLARDCMAPHPEARPSFHQVLERLKELEDQLPPSPNTWPGCRQCHRL